MTGHTWFLTIWLAAAPWALQAEELPIVFGRSGQKLTMVVRGDDGKPVDAVVLSAFGWRWAEPIVANGGAVEIVAPSVRVPVVFRMMPKHDSKLVLSELVVYPDAPIAWDKDTQLVTAGTPTWFDSWSEVTGLPVEKLAGLESLSTDNWRMLDKPGLLVVGGSVAGSDLATICRLAAENKINVLVLEANWFGSNKTTSCKFGLSPKRGSERLQAVFSCLPWRQLLGRTETADDCFLRLLTETAKGTRGRSALDGRRHLDSQLHLVQLFTEWNISLTEVAQEADRENDKNE